jgi:hypothetical protein
MNLTQNLKLIHARLTFYNIKNLIIIIFSKQNAKRSLKAVQNVVFIESYQVRVKVIHGGGQGSPPCPEPLVRLYLELLI